jgi:hypothetical protein
VRRTFCVREKRHTSKTTRSETEEFSRPADVAEATYHNPLPRALWRNRKRTPRRISQTTYHHGTSTDVQRHTRSVRRFPTKACAPSTVATNESLKFTLDKTVMPLSFNGR